MSITTVDRSKSLSSPVVYAVYGNRTNAKSGQVRATALTVVCGSEMDNDSDGRWAGIEFIESGRDIMNNYSNRSNRAITLVQSWSRDELNRDDPSHVEKANAMGTDLAQRLAPDTPFVVATHTDSKSGCVHNHLILLNHDLSTGKATPKRAGNWHAVKVVNDDVMRDWGMRRLEPEGFVKLRRAERMAIRDGKSIDSTGLGINDLTGDTWADYLRKRVDELIADDRVLNAPDGLNKAHDLAVDYNLSLKMMDDELSIGLVDDNGKDMTYTTRTPKGKSRKRKAADAGSKFGPGYTTSGLSDRIAEAQAQLAAAIARQTRIDRIKHLNKESENDSESTTDRASATNPRDISGRESGPRLGSPGDLAESTYEGLNQDSSSAQSSERVGNQDPIHRSVGEGTSEVIRAATEARRAAEKFSSNHRRDEGVRPGAAGGRGDHQQSGKHADGHGPVDEKYPENTRRPRGDVPRNAGGREASGEAQRRKRQERLERLNQAANYEPEF